MALGTYYSGIRECSARDEHQSFASPRGISSKFEKITSLDELSRRFGIPFKLVQRATVE